MCTPTLIMAGALEIGSQVSNHLAKDKESKEARRAAATDMRLQYSDVNARQIEEQKAAANQILAGVKQKQSAQGTALAQAAGANVGGLSVQALLNTIEGDAAEYTDSVQENLEMIGHQTERDRRAILAGAQGRFNAAQSPSLIGSGLRIAGSGLNLYRQYQGTQPNNPSQSSSSAGRNPNAVPGK